MSRAPFLAVFVLGTCSCGGMPASSAEERASIGLRGQSAARTVADDARGGRLFDRWFRELGMDFEPGAHGGPRGDGSLLGPGGEVRDARGHGYRLKNFFGWDLRGSDGVYGPRYQNKPYVLSRNLLAERSSVEALETWWAQGDADIPAYAEVLGASSLRDMATFVAKVQRGQLPHPAAIWSLSTEAPNNYVLNPGADLLLGALHYDTSCAGCHGSDGTEIAIHNTMSVGVFARTKAYEGWSKVLHGHPGTQMQREIEFDSAPEAAAITLGILARLCDRTAYPPLPGHADVADGDLRCGPYLNPDPP